MGAIEPQFALYAIKDIENAILIRIQVSQRNLPYISQRDSQLSKNYPTSEPPKSHHSKRSREVLLSNYED